jgi:hypothetical protein
MEAAIAGSPPFTFVYGTRDPAATAILRARALALATRLFGLDSTRVLADRDATEARLAAGPVYLVGGPGENEWTRRLAPALPISFEATGFRWQGRLYDQPLEAIHLSWPNPLEPRWFLILAAGNSPAALARRGGFRARDDSASCAYELLRASPLHSSPRNPAYDAHPIATARPSASAERARSAPWSRRGRASPPGAGLRRTDRGRQSARCPRAWRRRVTVRRGATITQHAPPRSREQVDSDRDTRASN